MMLVPKIPKVSSVDQFRHIILDNFIYKIISKIIVDRRDFIAGRIASPNH